MQSGTKKKAVRGTIWSGIERFSVQGISFIVMIVMARMLTPSDYGLIGMLTVFIAISQSLVDSGFSQALIRKQNRNEIDNSTVFYFNIATSIILYFILFFCAPLIADFYNEPILIPITRIISLSVIINSFAVVQRALLSINIDFKTQAKASVIASIISGTIGITLAYSNYGVWSIVIYQLSNWGINTLSLWIFSKWRPKLAYSWLSFKELFSFGSKLALTSVLSSIYDNLFLIIIGKIYRPAELGYYTRAYQFATFPSTNITAVAQRVIFPILCQHQNNNSELIKNYIPFLRIISLIVFPLMFGLIGISDVFVPAILGDQWTKASSILQILCLSLMWYPLQSLNISLLQVKGRTDLVLKIDLIKKIIGILLICIFAPFGVVMLCVGNFISTLIATAIHLYYTHKLLGFSGFSQLKIIYKIIICSIAVCLTAYFFTSIIEYAYWIKLTIGIISGISTFFVLSYCIDKSEFINITKLFKSLNHG